jgi:hypothetical protein
MDKLQLTRQNVGRVFNSRNGCMCAMHLCCFEAKWPGLKLKTWSKQLLAAPAPVSFRAPRHPICCHVAQGGQGKSELTLAVGFGNVPLQPFGNVSTRGMLYQRGEKENLEVVLVEFSTVGLAVLLC